MSGNLVQVTLGDSQIKIHAHTIQFLPLVLDLLCFLEMTTVYWGIFASLNFRENGNFNNFAKNIFMNDPRGHHKRCGMAIFHGI